MEDYHCLKTELKDVRCEFDSLSKSVKIITSETQSLDNILNDGKSRCDKKGLSFSGKSFSRKTSTVFIRASSSVDDVIEELILKEEGTAVKTKIHRAYKR